MSTYKAAVIQIDTKSDKDENLARIEQLIQQAAISGVILVSLPEVMNVITGGNEPNTMEPVPGYTTNRLKLLAQKYDVWIHGGSILEKNSDKKPYNTTVMISPTGDIVAKYRKLHLFDVEIGDGLNIKESDRISAGKDVVTAKTEIGHLGFSICYDIRFPEIFRLMTLNGAEIIFTPANFTYPTGEAHWESILRCRAIENGCYIISAGQCGEKPRFRAYGSSMIIDPWGKIIARMADEGEGVAIAEIDLTNVMRCRKQIPVLRNRRGDLYALSIKEYCHG